MDKKILTEGKILHEKKSKNNKIPIAKPPCLKNTKELIFCNNCKYLNGISYDYRCLKEENIRMVYNAFKQYSIFPYIEEVNKKNDCKYFEFKKPLELKKPKKPKEPPVRCLFEGENPDKLKKSLFDIIKDYFKGVYRGEL